VRQVGYLQELKHKSELFALIFLKVILMSF